MEPRRLFVLVLSLLLIAGLPAWREPLAADGALEEFKAKIVKVSAELGTQTGDLRCHHELGEAVRVGGQSFPVKFVQGRLRVAVTPGGPAGRAVSEDKPVKLHWGDAEAGRSMLVWFSTDAKGNWRYSAGECARFKTSAGAFNLVDVNLDGIYGDPGVDGWFPGDTNFVLPLAETLHMGSLQVKVGDISPDGSKLTASVQQIDGTPTQRQALEALNRLRAANGLGTLSLDPKLSSGCTQHAEYLDVNSWDRITDPHSQNLGPKGKSAEGAAAARSSVIWALPPVKAIDGFRYTWYHRNDIMHPLLNRIGVNATPASLAVINVSNRSDAGGHWTAPVSVPADGWSACPRRAVSEKPRNPVSDMRSRGFPITVWIPKGSHVTDADGSLYLLKGSKQIEVKALPVAYEAKEQTLGLVPANRLMPATDYLAVITWRADGQAVEKRIRFRTR